MRSQIPELENYIREERKNNKSWADIFYELVQYIQSVFYDVEIDEDL